jgi:hypothetical protein
MAFICIVEAYTKPSADGVICVGGDSEQGADGIICVVGADTKSDADIDYSKCIPGSWSS